MKLNFTLTTLMLAASAASIAAPVSPEEALSRAIRSGVAPTMRKAPAAGMKLAAIETAPTSGRAAVYTFDMPGSGFAILTADDNLPAVLGYTDNGSWAEAMAYDNFKSWIETYLTQIDAYYAAPETCNVYQDNVTPMERQRIEPILATKWNQDYPYNLYSPTTSQGSCMTGCVATAMAQVLKHYEWPREHGKGFHSYMQGNTTISFDYENTGFDWDNMLDTYVSGQFNDEQARAVGVIMKACGVSVNMQYSNSASGAFSQSIAAAMVNIFGYDKGINFLNRALYTFQEWNDIVYAEIAAGRPVIYNGESGQGSGHCFVCDGYSEDNYFHFNWGWSGTFDGYFLLHALEPGAGQPGGGSGIYNYNQMIVTGIQPPVEGSWFHLPLIGYGECTYKDSSATADGNGLEFFLGSSYNIYNFSGFTFEAECAGIVMTEGIVRAVVPSETILEFEKVADNGGIYGNDGFRMKIYPDQVPEGESMILVPAMRSTEGGEWARIRFQNGNAQNVLLDNMDGKIYLARPLTSRLVNAVVTDLEADESPEAGKPFGYRGKIRSFDDSDSRPTLYLTATDNKDGTEINIASKTFKLSPDVTEEFSYTTKIGLPAGLYTLDMRDELGRIVSYLGQVNIGITGVDAIADTASGQKCTVFTPQGVKAGEGMTEAEATAGLDKGIYIIRTGNKAKTAVIR